MIGRIAGRIDMRGPDHVLIDVRGVGYVVFASDRTLMALPGPGEAAALYTELIVREDLLQLYGFPTLVEKEWFRLLTSVQGVGAKGALAILGALGADGLSRAIALGDQASVKAAKGIGPKTAQRIVLELKDKAPAVMAMGGTAPTTTSDDVIEPDTPSPRPPKPVPGPAPSASAQAEALSALGNLGYAPSEAAAAVAEAAGETPEADTPTLIRAALKKLAPKG
ncbi:Holliday junction branch migration protein RuvA [Pseudooceanicola sp.]|uniref:Holliday junction branch migration protein RuvA n=1 Tax=Pseudooceanicola sp. TaxID=1914328 RepID=UPI0035C6B600